MFPLLIEKLVRHEDLTTDEAAQAMREVMEGRAAPSALAGLLAALVMKGERPEEIAGLARTMREHAVQLTTSPGEVFDTCGTGGDRSGTFNVSSAAAVVVAACGVKVAKHGNRSVSSRCGSADVFEQLGVNLAAAPAVVERALHSGTIAFFFAPTFHPSMKHAGPTRREMGVRTAFNLLGPLTNPAGATRQVVGVPRADLTDLLARSLRLLGSTRAWVKNYSILLGLTKNPKTPLAMSLTFVHRLNDRDLRGLSIDRNVPEPLRIAARKKVVLTGK